MDRLTRILVCAAIVPVVASIGLTGAFVVVNADDEALTPEAARMLQRPPNPYAPATNLSVALAGFDAPPGASIIAEGEKALAERDRVATLSPKEREAAYEEARADAGRLRVAGNFDCRPAFLSCWRGVESRRDEHRRALAANAELYRRYVQLHAMRGYFDTGQPLAWLPTLYIPPPIRSLFVEAVALRVKDARSARERSAALAELDRDIRMWRAMLTGQGTLLSKFVAIHSLHGDYALLADILGDARTNVAPHLAEIEAMLARLAPNDWKVTAALDYEFRMIAAVYDEIDREQGLLPARAEGEKAPWWQAFLPGDASGYFQPNATKNLAARHIVELKRLTEADGSAFRGQRESLRRWREQHLTPGLAYLRNPLGHILVGLAPQTYDDYPLRAHDIAGFHRLVRLGFEIRKQGIGDDAIPAFIKRNGWAVHPVSAEPFAWDASKRELVMTPLAPVNKERRFRIPVK